MRDRTISAGAKIAILQESDQPYGQIPEGTIIVSGGVIDRVGATSELPVQYSDYQIEDLHGRLVTPGLIDALTHVVYGGDRAEEFEMRLTGAGYDEIACADLAIWTVKRPAELSYRMGSNSLYKRIFGGRA